MTRKTRIWAVSLELGMLLMLKRPDSGCRCGTSRYGLCLIGQTSSRVWTLHLIRWLYPVLGFCYFEGYHNWSKRIQTSINNNQLTAFETVAVMSTLVGNIVIKVQKMHPDIEAVEIARTLAVVSGCVVLFIGLARIGWIVEWISLTAITAFMTGSAITIGVGQIPALLGIPGINNRGPAYEVFINTLKALPKARLDAAMGVSALFLLYFIRFGFEFLSRRYPARKKTFFFLSTLRIAFVLLLYILISWLVNRGIKDAKKAHFKILGKVPRGKQPPPTLNVLCLRCLQDFNMLGLQQ